MDNQLPLRITFRNPPRDVDFRLKRGEADLIPPARRSDTVCSFELTVRVAGRQPDGSPRLLGPFTHRRPQGRILIVTSGTLAGQTDSCWTRAASVPLSGISWELIEETLATEGAILESYLPSTARDGGPACATLRLLDGGWRVSVGG
jgi:hypothetical protein